MNTSINTSNTVLKEICLYLQDLSQLNVSFSNGNRTLVCVEENMHFVIHIRCLLHGVKSIIKLIFLGILTAV